ncbi:MAG: Ribosomal RNA small subunit methyltransferase I [Microgenomates bacterium OLB23]|nr:MAG: Ribosomal RNA small subunit methyltransferase I [Microgenomates bacterium OLB23]
MLYIVGTAIGNIEDTSYRAITTLTQADIILAEDTRTFRTYYDRLQDLFDIRATKEQTVKSLYKENEFAMISEVLEEIHLGKDVALVSESGMPAISDPGALLIKHVRLNNFPYTVIPGPTAFATAAVHVGVPHSQIAFLGFLPKKESELLKLLNAVREAHYDNKTLYICYESPHRYAQTVKLIKTQVRPSEFYLARELTKKI